MGIRLMIIELRKYNEIRELLIENRTTGSQAQVSYRTSLGGICNWAAVPHGGEGDGDANQDTGAHTNRLPDLVPIAYLCCDPVVLFSISSSLISFVFPQFGLS